MNIIAVDHKAIFDEVSPFFTREEARPLVLSVLTHIVVFILVVVGIPHIKQEVPVMENSITIEIVEIDEVSRTNKSQAQNTPKPVSKPDEIKQPPKQEKSMPPTVTSEKPPRPVVPAPPDVSVAAPREAEDLKPREKEVSAAPKAAPKPPPRRPVLTQDVQKADQEEAMNALLKNLMESAAPPAPQQPIMTGVGDPAPRIPLGERMTTNEQERLKQQLAMCWNVTAGARYAESLIIEVSLTMNHDRTVREARIKDQFRYNRDSFFRAAADSALRAVHHPRCTPLLLPLEKYEQWKVINITFDPREMLQ